MFRPVSMALLCQKQGRGFQRVWLQDKTICIWYSSVQNTGKCGKIKEAASLKVKGPLYGRLLHVCLPEVGRLIDTCKPSIKSVGSLVTEIFQEMYIQHSCREGRTSSKNHVTKITFHS